jgi:LPXTG-motif cell wall-anchored protein
VLDWQWDFEGDDVYDTLLGNLAADGEELSLTIVIETLATQCSDPDNSSGDLPPTGDDNSTFVWLLAAILAFAGIYIVLMAKKRRPIDDQL